MKPEAILSRAPISITQAQREFYFENGYLVLEKFIPDEWLERLWTVTNRFIDESRSLTGSNDKFDVEAGHTAENPRLRRLTQPVEHDPLYWEFACKSPLTDLAEDLLGPDLLFHHAKLNFKWSGGGEEVKWHQDIPFWPHTNDSVMTMGLYLEDVDDVMGPLGVIPGSHRGETYDHYNSNDEWVGALSDADHAKADPEKNAVYLPGPAGSVTVHHCRTLHGSRPNMHPTRPCRPQMRCRSRLIPRPQATTVNSCAAGQHNTLIWNPIQVACHLTGPVATAPYSRFSRKKTAPTTACASPSLQADIHARGRISQTSIISPSASAIASISISSSRKARPVTSTMVSAG